ncbi:beta-glucosidase BglX [Tamlana sp. 2201CG12-4]|uniref:beta-glucosidase BglX n=1 Tax=Tamlana sp. 2201CG12-4 TaxID=3112582 RepID=UPI002DBB1015|nr:beta-glucosidase BglX [Tamlana sp. 2201CG12-4]MEC3905725.1 beta-glucosidase BglX [Tamlana sp. 2201CG12-4]
MKTKNAIFLAFILGIVFISLLAFNFNDKKETAFESWNADDKAMNAKVDSLLSVMTLDEKIGQTVLLTSTRDVTGPSVNENYEKLIKEGKVGNIFNAYEASFTRNLQKMAVENTRLGIPLLFGYDVIHGHKTIFPISLGESASFDLQAIENAARIAAVEASAEGLHWTFAPMVDVARDPRWGRVSEGSGEDVYYSCEVAKARVKGFQGEDLKATNTILACAKHYAAYGAAQAGRDYHTVDVSDRELRTTYLPPFKATVDAGVASFMTSFNELNGVPATGNKYLLKDILRDEWGFKGFVVTDYQSINEMVPHGIVKDEEEAVKLAIDAGVDMDLQGEVYSKHLKGLIENGTVPVEKLDTAVRRILELKYALGLFEDPYRYSDEDRQKKYVMSEGHLEAARDMARKSMVLLKNENQTLPLSKNKKIALIGPLSNTERDMIGSWSGAGKHKDDPVTVLEGFVEMIGAENVIHAEGTKLSRYMKRTDAPITSGFSEAIAAAKKADVIVAAMGELQNMSGEASCRTDLDLPGNQKELLKELKKLNKPIVLVLLSGRPLTLEWEDNNMDAILEAWFPGTMGGHAIADIVFGDAVPSGKLPLTFPRSLGQVPLYYNMKNTGRPIKPNVKINTYKSMYLDNPNTPLYPFGYGLSYTTFEYKDLKLSNDQITNEKGIKVSVDVTNTGNYDGEEVVQLYIKDIVGSVTRPVKELKGFQKVLIRKGETKTIAFNLSIEDLKFYDIDMNFVAEKGDFKVFVGGDSEAKLTSGFSYN